MADLIFIPLVAAFFALAWRYAVACDRL